MTEVENYVSDRIINAVLLDQDENLFVFSCPIAKSTILAVPDQ